MFEDRSLLSHMYKRRRHSHPNMPNEVWYICTVMDVVERTQSSCVEGTVQ